MSTPLRLLAGMLVFAAASARSAAAAETVLDGKPLAAKIASAGTGETVSLPAGTFATRGIDVPSGVSLKGAGYGKTVLVVQGQDGIRIQGGAHNEVSDLTVRGALRAGIAVENSSGVTIRRVRVVRNLIGMLATGSKGVRLENIAAGENRTGIVLVGLASSSVVNCSMVKNSALALSISRTEDCAAFNNLMAGSPLGVFVAEKNSKLMLDYNAYMTSLIGKGKDVPIPSVFSWRDLSGFDGHSTRVQVRFSDEAGFDYRPAGAMDWALDRAVTAGWGIQWLGPLAAPPRDIDGQARTQGICAGAYEARPTPPRPADGSIEILGDDGLKSAGLYDREGRCVRFLFSTLPLHKGTYGYWLPSRNWKGDEIAPGQYEIRVAEAALAMKYVASPGNTSVSSAQKDYASTGVHMVVLDSKDRPIFCHHWSEGYKQYRAMDEKLEHERWSIAGCNTSYGAASDGKGWLYALRDADKETVCLVKINEETGQVHALSEGVYAWFIKKANFSDRLGGLALLGDSLYLADVKKGKLFIGDVNSPTFEKSIDVHAPSSPVGDPQRGWIWVLSDRREVLAVDPSGAVKARFDPEISGACSLAVRGNRMAIVGIGTGKIHRFDCTDPAHIKPAGTIGRGDGRFGKILPDRFLFQGDPTSSPGANVAMNSQGDVAVVDQGVKLFGLDGSPKRLYTGIWAQYIEAGLNPPGQPLQLIEKSHRQTYLLDEQTGTWQPEATWKVPEGAETQFWHFFLHEGKRYGVHFGRGILMIARYDNYVGTPLVAFRSNTFCEDFSGDLKRPGVWKPILGSDGKPIHFGVDGVLIPSATGDLLFAGGRATRVRFLGVDGRGVPQYDWAHATPIKLTVDKDENYLSPYDSKTKENIGHGVRYTDWFADGSLVATTSLKTNPGSGFPCWAGTDVAGFDAEGKLKWFQPFPHMRDVQGTKIVDDLVYTTGVGTSEVQIFDKDGLFLGVTGVPKELYWHGMWLDNIHQYTALKGATGRHYVIFGNFNDCTTWWMEVAGVNRIARHRAAVTIPEAKAAALAALPPPAPPKRLDPMITKVTIKRLSAPLKMDGSMEKWRRAVGVPQILITPETGDDIAGPADCSAVVRLAHENHNLYVQVIRFDDVVTMHQPLAQHFKQDSFEMSLNSFVHGIKLNVTRVRDHGEVVYRDGWFIKPKLLDAAKVPRKIRVLENARDVEERRLIEQIYGEDLSGSKVIVTEFMVPLDKETFEQRETELPAGTSGSTMYLGIAIDDNDTPGADVQRMILWPATYGTFAPKEGSAIVTFE